MAQRNAVAKVTFPDGSDTSGQWSFADGGPAEVADLAEFTPEMVTKLARHGLKQKLSDSYAGVKGDIKAAREAFVETLTNLKNGVWATRVAGEGGVRTSMLVEALAQNTSKAIEECQKVINTLAEQDEADDGARIATLRKHPQIQLAMAQIKVARAQAAVAKEGATATDVGSLLVS